MGTQDFSAVFPKIKANEPDILLLGVYGQDPGSFANQSVTAGLKATIIGFEFTPDGVNASKGTYDSVGWTFAYDYFDANNPISPLAKLFVDEFQTKYGEDARLLRRQLLREHAGDVGGHPPGPEEGRRHQRRRPSSTRPCRTTSRSSACTAATRPRSARTRSTRRRTRWSSAAMGVFEYKGGKVTPKAFFGIDGADFKDA